MNNKKNKRERIKLINKRIEVDRISLYILLIGIFWGMNKDNHLQWLFSF